MNPDVMLFEQLHGKWEHSQLREEMMHWIKKKNCFCLKSHLEIYQLEIKNSISETKV